MRIYAAIMTRPTEVLKRVQALNGFDKATSQVDLLTRKVGAAWATMNQERRSNPVEGGEQFVFLAPEYFFSNQRLANDRFYSQDVKRCILARLAKLARMYPQLLIIPGTMLWTKDAFKENETGRAETNLKVASKVWDNIRKNEVEFGKTGNHPRNWAHWTHRGPKDDKGWKQVDGVWNKGQDLQLKYLGKAGKYRTRIAKNVAYVCLGEQILKYHKVGNFQEVAWEPGTIVFEPGAIRGRFRIGDVRYSLEVCKDYAVGVVDSGLKRPSDYPHVRIIVSSWVDYTRTGREVVVLHSSTEKSGKPRSDGKGGQFIPLTDPTVLGEGCKLVRETRVDRTLTVYTIDVDNKVHHLSPKNDYTLCDTELKAVRHVHEDMLAT